VSDEAPDWVAMFDQALRSVGDLAKLMRTYYVALVHEGFREDQAALLTVAYQAAVLQAGQS
jgi:hypothetical protein